jgi:hypothetical protein
MHSLQTREGSAAHESELFHSVGSWSLNAMEPAQLVLSLLVAEAFSHGPGPQNHVRRL